MLRPNRVPVYHLLPIAQHFRDRLAQGNWRGEFKCFSVQLFYATLNTIWARHAGKSEVQESSAAFSDFAKYFFPRLFAKSGRSEE